MQTQTTTNIYQNKAHRVSKQQQPQDRAIKAVFPTLNSEATALTMDAYRLYIDDYNRSVEEENEEIINIMPLCLTPKRSQHSRTIGGWVFSIRMAGLRPRMVNKRYGEEAKR